MAAHKDATRAASGDSKRARSGAVWGPRPSWPERRQRHPLCFPPREGRGTDRGRATPCPARPPGHSSGEGGTQAAPPPPPRRRLQAAPGAWGCSTTPAEHVHLGGMRPRRRGVWAGGHRPPHPEEGGGEPRRDPPPLSPHSALPTRGPAAVTRAHFRLSHSAAHYVM